MSNFRRISISLLFIFLTESFSFMFLDPPTSPYYIALPTNVYMEHILLQCKVGHGGGRHDNITWAWYKNGTVVFSSTNNLTSTLTINSSDPILAEGKYTCNVSLAENMSASAVLQLTLKVDFHYQQPEVRVTADSNSFDVTCIQSGYVRPSSYVTFYKDGKMLSSEVDSKYNIADGSIQDSNLTRIVKTSLTVVNISQEDFGEYSCQLNMSAGNISEVSILVVADCGDPGYSANGTRNLTDTTEGSLVTYTCDLGYRIIGNNSRECKRDRMWSGRSPVCQAVECPFPVIPQNGNVNISSRTYGSTATFECRTGFDLQGTTNTTCQKDGTWLGEVPTCQLSHTNSTTSTEAEPQTYTPSFTMKNNLLSPSGSEKTPDNEPTKTENTQTISKVIQTTSKVVQTTSNVLQTTSNVLQTTSKVLQTTSNVLQTTSKVLQTTSKVLQTTSKVLQTTSKVLQTTSKVLQTTSEDTQGTSENIQPTIRNIESTSSATPFTSSNILISISSESGFIVPTSVVNPTNGNGNGTGLPIDLWIIIAAGAGGGGGLLLLCFCLCCCCCIVYKCRKYRREKMNKTYTLDRGASLRRLSTLERKASVSFLDDNDYVVKVGERGNISRLSATRESINEQSISDMNPKEAQLENGKDLHQGFEYQETGISSPADSELDSEIGGPRTIHSKPSPTNIKSYYYASSGPLSTPQYGSEVGGSSNSLDRTYFPLASPEKHIQQDSRTQVYSPLINSRNASHISAKDIKEAHINNARKSVDLGGDLEFDKKTFEEFIDNSFNKEEKANSPSLPSSPTKLSPKVDPLLQTNSHNYHPGQYRNTSSSLSYPYYHYPHHHNDDTLSTSTDIATNLSLTSSTIAHHGDHRTNTPLSVVSSGITAPSDTARQSWIADDVSESEQGSEPQQPQEQPNRELRRIRSDFQMKPPLNPIPGWSRVRSDSYNRPARPLRHASSAGPERFQDIQTKRERRRTVKDLFGHDSIDEFFEHVWTSENDVAQKKTKS